MTIEVRHSTRVKETIVAAKQVCGETDSTHERLVRREKIPLELVAEEDLFPERESGIPLGEKTRLYRISEDQDAGFALNRQAANLPAEVGRHNHAAWAGIEGEELNFFYDTNGNATWARSGSKPVRKGDVISLLPDDVHSIRIVGDRPLKNLRLYGKAIDQLLERVFWDEKTESWASVSPISGITDRKAQ